MAYPLLYIDKVKDNQDLFAVKVRDIANKLGIDPNWLMLQFQLESGLNPKAQNKRYPIQGGYATGLLQFAPNTAIALGTTTDQLLQMSNVEQLDYVYKYFQPYTGRIHSFEDLYLITFFPAALGYSDEQLLQSSSVSAESVAKSNPPVDLDKNGTVTVGEFKKWVKTKIPFGFKTSFGRTVMTIVSPITENPTVVIIIVLLFSILIYLLIKRSKK